MYDVIVIGAGVVGAMIARKLSAYEMSVCIVEKENDVSMGASKANSAIVHAGFDAKEGSLKARLNVKGSQMMEKIASELGVKYRKNGSIVIAFNNEDRKTLDALLERGKKNGVEDLRIVEGEELKKLEKNISDDVVCALYAPSGAIICPYELTLAAIGNAIDNGADLKLCFEVSEIETSDSGYKVVSKDGDVLLGRFVVNAAGIFSDKIAAMIGDNSFSITPRRGEYILLDKKCGDLVEHTVFRTPSEAGKGILVTPTVDGNLLLGPTSVVISDKDDRSTTDIGLDRVAREAIENVKNIDLSKRITSFCGLRAVGDTGDFIINSPKKGFVNVGAVESPGLSASPAIAIEVEDILRSQGLSAPEKVNYDPKRRPMHFFRDASVEKKNEIIKRDPAYGRIICRCEGITEGEIREALRTEPKARDLDGIKRRTRAQMGRCQGGFCGPQIIKIISEELGIAYGEVTKFGKGSTLVFGKTKEEICDD
ncbi:MAG: NAD(P)/FAD-dependent oxidoreductase [Clostridia bacterium]|nr:NAD(P)/FAD-dependent oxidoreductase [Clostridia bacterium]